MAAQFDGVLARRVLTRYMAMSHDLDVRPSPVLRARIAEALDELLTCTGATTVEQARELVDRSTPPALSSSLFIPVPRTTRSTVPRQKDPEARQTKTKSKKRARRRNAQRKWSPSLNTAATRFYAPATLPHVVHVVSGGLPGSARRH